MFIVTERMKLPSQMQVYVRRWHPSEFVIDTIDEVILDSAYLEDLKQKVCYCHLNYSDYTILAFPTKWHSSRVYCCSQRSRFISS